MKVIIAGSRKFEDYPTLRRICNRILKEQKTVEIVCGMARGADKLGMEYANQYGYKVTCMPADWDKEGKSAGYIRNKKMADYADALIVFWDGESKGSKMMIDLAKKAGLQIKIYNYGKDSRRTK